MGKNLLQKIAWSLLVLTLLMSFETKAQDCATLYLSEGFSGKVYSINPGTGAKVLVTTLPNSGQNLAVGPNPAAMATTVFTSSFVAANSPVYRNTTPIGANIPVALTGMASRTSNGFVYGVTSTRNLIEIQSATATNLGAITGDAYFNGAVISNDGFFNTSGELNVFAISGNFVYLYKIDVTTRIATQVVQVAGKLPITYDGVAFLNNNVYIASFLIKPGTTGNPDTYFAEIFQLNPLTGISAKVSEVDLGVDSYDSTPFPIDLASCANFTQPSPSPNCNTLYGVVATNGQIYTITPAAVSTTPPTTTQVGTAVANQGNIAVGPDVADLNSIRYVTSRNSAASLIYAGKNPPTPVTLTSTVANWNNASPPIGIATRASNGICYGINAKVLSTWNGQNGAANNATQIGTITSANAIWTNAGAANNTNGWILNDIGVDAPGNLYVVVMQGVTGNNVNAQVHLFRVDPATLVATLVKSSAVNALVGTDNGTSVNGNGLAYLNDGFYISRNNGTWTEIWKFDAITGVVTNVAVGTGKIAALALGDMASCVTVTKILANFAFNCGGATLQNDIFSTGSSQTSIIRVPITGAVSGQADFTVTSSGGDITASPSNPYTATILNGDTYVDIPIIYSGAAPSGSRTITVTTNVAGAGSCVFNINVCDGAAAVRSITQPTCAVPSGTMTVTSPVGANLEYSINSGTTFQPSPTFSGLAPGSYPFIRRDTTTGCAFISPNFTINAIPTPPAVPTATVTQPTCAVPSGTIVIASQLNVTYSIDNGGSYQVSNTFTGLVPGVYTLKVQSTIDTTCSTQGAATITINAVPTAPITPTTLSVTQPTCAVPTGTIVINTQAGVEYSINGGSSFQPSNTFSGQIPGNYTLMVRLTADNTCSATNATQVTINAVPSPPTTPTIATTTQPTCAVPSGTIVFTSQAGVEYSIGGAYQVSATFSGLAPGTYTPSVRNAADNTCITNAAANVTINAIPTAPTVPTISSVTQPTCSVPSGTIVFTAQAGVQYSIDGSTYQASSTFSGVPTGTYTPSVRNITDNTCVTNAASTVTINAIPTAPTTPTIASVTQPTCSVPTGTIVFNSQAGVQYSINGSTYQAGTTFSGVAPGTWTPSVRNISDNTCITNAASTVTINAVPSAPATPTIASVTQPTCAVPSGAIVFNAQAGVQYSIGGAYQVSTTFSGLAPGTYTPSVRNISDNTCITNAAANVTINAIPTAPTVPTISSVTQPTCSVPSGTIVFTTQAGVQYSIDGTNYFASSTFSGVPTGTYTPSVRNITDNTCVTNAASTVTINAIPTAPTTPTIASVTQPTCAVPSGTIVFTSQAGVQYSYDGITYQASATITGVPPGTYTPRVRNISDNTCTTGTSSTVTINAVPSAPATPTIASVTQPTCAITSGTIVFNTQVGVQYSIDGTNYFASATFSGLPPGTYTPSVRNATDNTCITNAAANVTINAVPTAPATPTVLSVVQPTCSAPSGTITINSQAGVDYGLNGGSYQASNVFAGLAPGNYIIEVRNTGDATCRTTGTTVTINVAPGAPAVPTVATVTQPTCAVPSGTIVIAAQSGVDYSVNNGGSYTASNNFSGLAPGSYIIKVRSLTDSTCSTQGATVTINAVPTPPSVPTISSVTQPTCSVPSGTIVFNSQAGVEYSINGTNYFVSPNFTGVGPGTYTPSVRNATDTTCITSAASTVTINSVPTPPLAPTISSVTQPTCAVPTGTIVFTAQAGVEYSINGINYFASTTFSGVVPGTYTPSVRNTSDNTCITNAAANVTINAAPSAPANPTIASVTQPTCSVPTGTIVFTSQPGVQYSINGVAYQASTTFSGVVPGTYTPSVRNISDNTCITPAVSNVTINAVPSAPATPTISSVTQPTCSVPFGTIVFNSQAGVQYSIDGSTYQASPNFTSVPPGTYTPSVRNTADITCVASSASTVTINSVPTPPVTPTISSVTQPTCAVPSGTIVFNSQAGVQYSIDGVTYQASTTFTGVAPGTWTPSVRNISDNTCIATAAANVTINAVPSAPANPTISSVTQPTCASPSGTIIFNSQAGVQYSYNGVTYQASPTFVGVPSGTWTPSVRNPSDTTCVTTAATSVTINAVPTAPTAPTTASVTQPTCAISSGTIVFNSQAGVDYSIGSGYQSSATFSGVAPGTYTLMVRNTADNTCSATGTSTVTINPIPSAPAVPTVSSITQPTCAVPTGTVVLNTQAGVEYSIIVGVFQGSNNFTGVVPGTYTPVVRNLSDNTCSTSGATITVNPAPGAPATPTTASVTQPTCATPSGTITFNSQAGVQYSINGGGTYQASPTFSVLAPGTYTLIVRNIADTTCSATATSTVTINSIPSAPATPTTASITQPTCAVPSGTIVFNSQAGVEYSVDGGTSYQPGVTFSGLAPGTYTLMVRNLADNTCSASIAGTITINSIPSAPTTPTTASVTQPTCAVPSGTIVFNSQAGVEYSIDNGVTYQAGTTFAGLIPGTYFLMVRNLSDTTCSTSAASTVTINAVPSAPATPTVASVTQPTCGTGVGTIVFNAQAGVEYSVDNGTTYQPSTTFSGLLPGTYTLVVRNLSDTTCSTPAASTVVITVAPGAPAVPTTASVTQPTCAVPSGTIVFNTQAGTEYSIDNGATYQVSATFPGLAPAVYTLRVRSTADNTCTTGAASTVTINAVPSAPVTPTTASVTQPTCATPSGTIVFNSQAGVEYSVDGGTSYQPSATFSGLAPGTYTLIVRNLADATCSATGSSTVTINAVPTAPVTPTTASVTQPTCATPSGTIVFNSQAGVQYSIDNGTTYQASATFSGLVPGTYTLVVDNIADATCSATGASTVTINAVPTAPAAPTTASVTQPTCASPSGTIVFNAQAGVEYSVNGGVSYQPGTTFSGLPSGTYTLVVHNLADFTCSTTAGSTVVINAVPSTPVTPTTASVTQPTCAVPSGTIVFNSQAGVEYSINGGTTYQPSSTFSVLAPGTYTLAVRNLADATCSTISASTVTINPAPSPPVTPTTASVTQPTCAVPSGTIVFNSQAGTEYSIDGGTTYQPSTTFSGLTPGTYNLEVRNGADNTCFTSGSSAVTINALPTAPATPTVASVTQPTCGVPSGTIVFTAQAGVEYSIDNGVTFQPSNTFTGVASGTHILVVHNISDNTCSTNAATSVVINVVPTAPTVPTAATVVQPDCATLVGAIEFNSQVGVEYSIDGGTTYQASTTFTGLAPGTYTLVVRKLSDTTCTTAAASTVILNPATGCDTDGDGVIDTTEAADGTNPNDSCEFILANQTVPPSGAWNVGDCDGDGVSNGTEVTNGTNPLNPDTDGDGVTDGTEITDGTNALNQCSLILASQTLPPNLGWNNADCDSDGINNTTEVTNGTNPLNPDTDGDGVNDGTEVADGTNPTNSCSFVLAHQTLPTSGAWNVGDCDGDGVPNGTEITNGTNPLNPDTDGDGVTDGTEITDGTNPTNSCSLILASQTLPTSGTWNNADCDGDGLPNGVEVTNGTNPLNPDTDGDGVTDGTENADGTNPLNSCSFVLVHQTVPTSAGWNTGDCDGDGVPNGTETTNGTNPLNPDTDGDGVTDGTEITDGTSGTNPCSLILASQTLPTSGAWNNADCDGDGLNNGTEITDGTNPLNPDTDGDGVTDGTEVADGTNPTNSCSLIITHQTLPVSAAWNSADCDSDGLPNGTEVTNGTNPLNPDTDGDGVTDGTEITDGTSPTNSCSLILASQTLPPNGAWNNADCDGDGLPNGTEVTNGTNPLNPDTDGDGVTDGTEVADGTNPLNSCSFVLAHQTLPTSGAWNSADCDADGLPNGTEIADGTNPLNPDTDGDGVNDGTEIADGTNPLDLCSLVLAHQTLPTSTVWNNTDCDTDGIPNGTEVTNGTNPLSPDSDGDGVTDGTEITDGTNPSDSCSYLAIHQTLPTSGTWNNADCDGDGLPNGTEVTNGTNPLSPDTDGDGVTDGTEIADGTNPLNPCSLVLAHQTLPVSGTWNTADCDGDGLPNGTEVTTGTNPLNPDTDGDGVTDGTEIADGTNPLNSCSFVMAHQTLPPSGTWNVGDCDGDGLPNGTEVTNGTNPLSPDTDGDGVTDGTEIADGTNPTNPCSLVLAHQTLPVSGTWNTADCDGDGLPNGTEVTNGTNPLNPDTDGDGVTDGTEVADGTNPLNSCSFVVAHQTLPTSGTWNTADCDSDGLPNGAETTNGTNPLNPDTDGDGVVDGVEIADGTNPLNSCSLIIAHQTAIPSGTWNVADCDGDGIPNATEVTNGTNPLNPDTDGDGVTDGTEIADGTDPLNPCSLILAHQTLPPSTAWNNADCDNDGLPNGTEVTNGTNPLNGDSDGDGVIDGTEVADGTNPLNPCSLVVAHQTVTPNGAWNNGDCDGDGIPNGTEIGHTNPVDNTNPLSPDTDGDGVTDGTEIADGTNPTNPCSFVQAHQTLPTSATWNAGDCDADGLNNGGEVTAGTNPFNPDTDGDGVLDGTEVADGTNPLNSCSLVYTHITLPTGTTWNNGDCDADGVPNGTEVTNGTDPTNPDTDGDGVTDGQEITDNTDALDPCSLIVAHQTVSAGTTNWSNLDCDNDGVTNGHEIGSTPASPQDTDGDGIPDYQDTDDDGDNIPTINEHPDPNHDGDPIDAYDSNNNGTPDYLEPNSTLNSEDGLDVFSLVTPNGDGDNDVFVISNIEKYPDNTVEIYNRWGVMVYEARGYGQNGKYFKGISEGRVTVSQSSELPVGTYFYIIKYKNTDGVTKERSGYLYINR